MENRISKLATQDLSWMTNCEDFFNFSIVLEKAFRQADPKTKRSILKNITDVELKAGKLTYKLREPYSYLLELKEALPQSQNSYEPQKNQSVSGKVPVLAKEGSVWWSVLNKIRTYFKEHFFIPPA